MPTLKPVLAREEILALQQVVRRIPASPEVIHHALELVRRTRPGRDARYAAAHNLPIAEKTNGQGPSELIKRMVTFGAGPRAVQFLLLGAKARAVIDGRKHVSIDDVRSLAHPVLRHRILINYAAEAEGYDADRLIDHVLEGLPPRAVDRGVEAVLRR